MIMPRAGAMAAPAITVKREMERIVQVSFPLVGFDIRYGVQALPSILN